MMKKYPQSDLFERLACLEHSRWANWMEYLFSACEEKNGTMIIPDWAVKHWKRQIETRYENLSIKDQNNDREEVMKYWDLIKGKSK